MKHRYVVLALLLIVAGCVVSSVDNEINAATMATRVRSMQDNVTRGFLPVTPTRRAATKFKENYILSYCRTAITEGGYSGKNYYTPGGPYTNYWPVEFVTLLQSGRDMFTSDELLTLTNWALSKQIKDGSTTYTRPMSGGTDTYPLGTMPDYVPANGTMSTAAYVPQGDKPLLTHPYGIVYLAYHYGQSVSWNADWLSWWAAGTHRVDLENSFNSVSYNATSKLVTQYAGAYRAGGLSVQTLFDGDHVFESVAAYNTALMLAEMYLQSGGTQGEVDAWVAIAEGIRDGIRAAFVYEDNPLWEYYREDFWSYTRQAGVPENWPVSGGSGTSTIEAHPSDSTRNCLKLTNVSGTGYLNAQQFAAAHKTGGTDAYYRGKWGIVKVSASVAQTNVQCQMQFSNTADASVVEWAFGADGHLKYWDNSAYVNLPTDTTYSANQIYEFKAALNWTTGQYEVFIDNVSKGTVNFGGGGTTNLLRAAVFNCNNNNAAVVGTMRIMSILWADTPTAGDDTQPGGFLQWTSSGVYGRKFSVVATSYAVFSGVLTSDQEMRAARYMSLLLRQPDSSGVGRRSIFSYITNARGYVRWSRWSDDDRHGVHTWWQRIAADGGYQTFTDGGYINWGMVWVYKTLAIFSPTVALEYLNGSIDDAITIGVNAPYESIHGGTLTNAKYLQSAAGLYGPGSDTKSSLRGTHRGRSN